MKMLKFGFLLFHATLGQEVPVPQPADDAAVPAPQCRPGSIPIPMPVPVPFPVPVPVTVIVPVPVPVPIPVFGGGGGGEELPGPDHIDPSAAAACDAHPQCAQQGLHGACCPTDEGKMLECCSSVMDHWQADHKYIVTLNKGAVVYAQPDSTSDATGKTLNYGDTFDVKFVKKDEQDNTWLQTEDGWIMSECHETGEHVADHLIPPEPEVHMVTAPKGLVVRHGAEKTTEKVAVLHIGDTFHVLERAFTETGELRLRVGDGMWVSETCSKTGSRIAEPIHPKDGEQYEVTADTVTLYRDESLTGDTEVELKLQKGDKVEVLQRSCTPDKKFIFRSINGWFAEKADDGTEVVKRTLDSRPQAPAAPDAAAAASDADGAAAPADGDAAAPAAEEAPATDAEAAPEAAAAETPAEA